MRDESREVLHSTDEASSPHIGPPEISAVPDELAREFMLWAAWVDFLYYEVEVVQ